MLGDKGGARRGWVEGGRIGPCKLFWLHSTTMPCALIQLAQSMDESQKQMTVKALPYLAWSLMSEKLLTV